jgi:hypothetical protein
MFAELSKSFFVNNLKNNNLHNFANKIAINGIGQKVITTYGLSSPYK